MNIPMPGRSIPNSMREGVEETITQLEKLIDESDRCNILAAGHSRKSLVADCRRCCKRKGASLASYEPNYVIFDSIDC